MKSLCAQVLGVNRKNIYHERVLEQKDTELRQQITEVHQEHPAYGHRRIGYHLQINHKRVTRVMRKYHLRPPRRKTPHFCTHSVPHCTYSNLIRDISLTYEHQVWCADTSELVFHREKWYLVTIIDLFTRQVVGVALGRHHNSHLVKQALEDAILRTHTVPTIFHTDQGSEFMADTITSFLQELNIQISVSDKASPWQNGYQESFFGKLKQEWGDMNRFETPGEFIEELYHLIHYYNTERIHTALKMPPTVYANSLRKMSEKMGT